MRHPVAAGDRLLVTFSNRDVPAVTAAVDSAGDISMPLVGKLHVAGLTLEQAAHVIESAYYPQCWREPVKVSISRL